MSNPTSMFRFGQNWREYATHAMSADKLAQAKTALAALLGTDDLSGQRFMDIGCGSGLHSVSAILLGAEAVYAFDIDADSVAVTSETAERFLSAAQRERLHVQQASVLAPTPLEGVPQADIVYSWGVLHHTGDMYPAIEQASRWVAPNGLFVIAIYNRHITSPVWVGIKWLYNRVPRFAQRLMYALFYGVIYVAKFAVTGQPPHRKERGMDFGYDVIDWIGGYPYEYASIDEIVQFVTPLGFELVRSIPAEVGTGCNEFVFRRPA